MPGLKLSFRRDNFSPKMETLLEQQRRYHEERERLMDAMTKESLNPAKPVRSELESVKRLHFYDNVMGFRGLHFLFVAFGKMEL